MAARNYQLHDEREHHIAHLTEAAYHAVLERGYRGSFLELELSLWQAVRQSIERDELLRRPFPVLQELNVA